MSDLEVKSRLLRRQFVHDRPRHARLAILLDVFGYESLLSVQARARKDKTELLRKTLRHGEQVVAPSKAHLTIDLDEVDAGRQGVLDLLTEFAPDLHGGRRPYRDRGKGRSNAPFYPAGLRLCLGPWKPRI